tara:strand:- start:23016 stop:23495 length:480 start_codon:yes stop_codon:yes gene_type:complete
MNRILIFLSIAVYSIFIGSQITEGYLLVPYWKTLSITEFHEYYSKFGPTINKFYTVLTILATLIPISIGIYCFSNKFHALKYSIVSSFFALLVIVLFYIYFKDTNQQFYVTVFNTNQLKSVLETWGYWHWLRVLFEFLSLIFLILALNNLSQKKNTIGS